MDLPPPPPYKANYSEEDELRQKERAEEIEAEIAREIEEELQ